MLFKFEGGKVFSDSEWLISSDITFGRVASTIENLFHRVAERLIPGEGKERVAALVLVENLITVKAHDSLALLKPLNEKYEEIRKVLIPLTYRKRRAIAESVGRS